MHFCFEKSETQGSNQNRNKHYVAKCLIIYLGGSENGALCFTVSKKKVSCSKQLAQNIAVQKIIKWEILDVSELVLFIILCPENLEILNLVKERPNWAAEGEWEPDDL